MKAFNVYGMGNALVDLPVRLDEESFSALKLHRGRVYMLSPEEQRRLQKRLGLENLSKNCSGGGSAANSIYTLAKLSGRAAFSGRVANDQYGRFFRADFESQGVQFPNHYVNGGPTGTVVSLITPDGERTMCACLGVAKDFCQADIHKESIRASQWLFVEGYLFGNSRESWEAASKAMEFAKTSEGEERTKVIFSLSDSCIASCYRDLILDACRRIDLIIGDREQACTLAERSSLPSAFERLKDLVPNVIVTAGSKGAYIRYEGSEIFVPATPVTPIDTTGAGDTFAGAFLYGVTNGYSLEEAARGAGFLASRKVQQQGARLIKGVREAWEKGIERGRP